jgi:hypothetical protein
VKNALTLSRLVFVVTENPKSASRIVISHTFPARFSHAIIVMASLSLSSRVSLQARFGSKASRRVAASRGVRASALPQKGRPALTMVMRVPSAKESEVDALFASHEAMMHATHVIGEAEADDIGHPRMLEYYVAKSTELSDPLDAGTSPPPSPARHPARI